jgi:methylenetetrahydrofolate reductase (NADPH)
MRGKCYIEVLTPKQNVEDLDDALRKFSERFKTVVAEGYILSVTDNPMGNLHFQLTEIMAELGLSAPPEQMLLHLNTFHTKEGLDEILARAAELGIRQLLVVSGDGSERLPRLTPASIGAGGEAVTSVELLRYIAREYAGKFTCGVAFNQYEPQDHEREKLKRKIDAGASFVITQPAVGRDGRLECLHGAGLPATIGAWMSKKIELLSECVGYTLHPPGTYDPMANLQLLLESYPEFGIYLALLGFKTQLPVLLDMLRRMGRKP